MIRYGFNIKTRSGQRVDNICIMAANREEAERRLRQMYQECSIVDCRTHAVPARLGPEVQALPRATGLTKAPRSAKGSVVAKIAAACLLDTKVPKRRASAKSRAAASSRRVSGPRCCACRCSPRSSSAWRSPPAISKR